MGLFGAVGALYLADQVINKPRRPVKRTKIFDGKTYVLMREGLAKDEANYHKRVQKKKGNKVRIVRIQRAHWQVWVHNPYN